MQFVPLGKTISNCKIDLLCQAVVNRFSSFFFLFLFVVLKTTFESSSAQPRKQVQRHEQFTKIDNSIDLFPFFYLC